MIAATRYPAFSRNFEDEQDYADAAVSAARKANPLPSGLSLAPILRWKRRERQRRDRSSSGKLKCKTLVVGFEGGGSSFARKCFGLTESVGCDWIGTVVLPGAPPSRSAGADAASTTGGLGDSLDPADPLNSACNIFLKRGGGEVSSSSGADNGNGSVSNGVSNGESTADRSTGSTTEIIGGDESGDSSTPSPTLSNNTQEKDGHGIVVVLCGYRVPSRLADAWARALLGAIDAEVVVALATVAAEPGRSEGWQGARLVATAEAEEREDCLKMSVGFQPLRTPTMLGGAPAALVSYCQKHGRAAMCFAAAELPGRRAVPPQLVGGDCGSSGESSRFAERSLSCTWKALGVVAGEAMLSAGCGGGEGGEKDVDAFDGAANSLYI
eukprot:g14237.t1